MRPTNQIKPAVGVLASIAFVCFASLANADEARVCLVADERKTNTAPSATDTDEAIRLFREGALLEQAGKKEEAVKKFLESRRFVARKTNSTNAARLFQDLGRSDQALALFERILEEFDTVLSPAEKQAIQDRISQLRPKVAMLHFEADAGELVLDGDRCGRLPRQKDLYVLPGKHKLSLTRGREPSVFQIVPIAAGETRTVRFPVVPPPAVQMERWNISISTGIIFGPGMRSGPEINAAAKCDSNCPFAFGGIVLGRLEQELGRGFYLGIGTGYLEAASSFYREEERHFQGSSGNLVRYGFDETMRLRGPLMGLSLAYRFNTGTLSWSARNTLGLFSAQSVDEFDNANTLPVSSFLATKVSVSGDAEVRSVTSFVMPEIAADIPIYGRLRLGFSLGATVLLAEGTQLNRRPFGVEAGRCDAPSAGEVQTNPACAQWPALGLEREVSHGITYFVHPQIVLGISP